MIELLNKRDHYCKHFDKGNGEFICRQSLGLAHYFNGETFEEIENIPFPEGKEIKNDKDLEMIAIPEWAEVELSEDKKTAWFKDKKGVRIHVFREAIVCDKKAEPYSVVDKDGNKTELKSVDLVAKKQSLDSVKCEKIVVDKRKITRVNFAVKDGSLAFELPQDLEAKDLKAFDDTDTGSTNNKYAQIVSWAPTTVVGVAAGIYVYGYSATSEKSRCLENFTLTSGSGTITKIRLREYKTRTGTKSDSQINVYELSPTRSWVNNGACWNYYTGTTAWSAAGGDYNTTLIGHATPGTGTGEYFITLQGDGADNAFPSGTKTWGDTIDILFRVPNESGAEAQVEMSTKDNATPANRPYIEITYSAGGISNTKLNIGDTFKTCTKAQVNIGDSWKNITHAKVNIGDTWKTIF